MSPHHARRLDPDLDARLVQRCLDGDARAWQALVQRHERLVYAVARSFRLPEPDLADVFQDVFAALVRGMPRIRDARALVRWLTSTTERIAYAAALRVRRAQALSPATDPKTLESVPSAAADASGDLEVQEEQALIRLALAALAPRCRDLLQALYYRDPPASYAEIARALRVPIGSLGPTRARCFVKMREVYLRLSGTEAPGIRTVVAPTSANDEEAPDNTRGLTREEDRV